MNRWLPVLALAAAFTAGTCCGVPAKADGDRLLDRAVNALERLARAQESIASKCGR